MAKFCGDMDSTATLRAAEIWKQKCLLNGGSLFIDRSLWQLDCIEQLAASFIDNPIEGTGQSFIEKLAIQISDVDPDAKKLMAELLWVLYLCACTTISVTTKRANIVTVWKLSGEELDESHQLLQEEALLGVGSGGTGFNNYVWKELVFLIRFCKDFLALPLERRESLLAGDEFAVWLERIQDNENRQFRHMLMYMLFPEVSERCFSGGHRKKIAIAFGVQAPKNLSQAELDEALLKIRKEQAEKFGTEELDFYNPPLSEVWQKTSAVKEDIAEYDARSSNRKKLFKAWLETKHINPNSNVISSYLRAIDILSELVDLDIYSLNLGAELSALLGDVQLRQKDKDGPYFAQGSASYGQNGFFSAALKDYQQFLSEGLTAEEATVHEKPINLIFYGPPGTGKTYKLFGEYIGKYVGDSPTGDLSSGKRYEFVTFHQSYSYEEFVEGIRPLLTKSDDKNEVGYKLHTGIFKDICERAKRDPSNRYAIFIDEINRGNISKIFGELITLIEKDKRAGAKGEIELKLPYSNQSFSVPRNLDIYGTMNTADRSLAYLDTALRRRFSFIEIMPDPSKLSSVEFDGVEINLTLLLTTINQRLEALLDREHMIGHAYLMDSGTTVGKNGLIAAFKEKIIPQLTDYFYEDWDKVRLVLADNQVEDGALQFVKRVEADVGLFGGELPTEMYQRFTLNEAALNNPRAYIKIYSAIKSNFERDI